MQAEPQARKQPRDSRCCADIPLVESDYQFRCFFLCLFDRAVWEDGTDGAILSRVLTEIRCLHFTTRSINPSKELLTAGRILLSNVFCYMKVVIFFWGGSLFLCLFQEPESIKCQKCSGGGLQEEK